MEETRRKVLVADDELGPRESIRQILKDAYDVAFAENGDEVVDYVREHNDVGAVVMDIKMPGKDGLEALRELKEIRQEVEVLIITGYGSLDSAVKALKYGAFDYLTKPFEPEAIMESVARGMERHQAFMETQERLKKLEGLADDLRSHYVATAEKLIAAINDMDGYSCINTIRLATVVGALAEEMHYLPADVASIKHMAVLRDIGKISLDAKLLRKETPLSETERECMKRHPGMSLVLLRAVDFLQEFLSYIECHHERQDGSGYPHGLAGDEIPPEAGIISLADTYEAMVTKRPYRRNPLSHNEAVGEIRNSSGAQFGAEVVDSFLSISDLPARLKKIEERCKVEGADKLLREILLSGPGKEAGPDGGDN